MSLLSHATRCLANQERHAGLKAFLSLAQDDSVKEAAEKAGQRAEQGEYF